MKTWAEKRRRETEAIGATELAEMFQTIVKLYELEEQRRFPMNSERRRGVVSLTPKGSPHGVADSPTEAKPA